MPELPVISGRELRAALERLGWDFKRQNGSHMILTKPGHMASLSVPDHRQLAPGTLRALTRAAGLSIDELRAALSRR
jgi:predicted RNA binding protein YcfA (HicA-like mRNA interferase family)